MNNNLIKILTKFIMREFSQFDKILKKLQSRLNKIGIKSSKKYQCIVSFYNFSHRKAMSCYYLNVLYFSGSLLWEVYRKEIAKIFPVPCLFRLSCCLYQSVIEQRHPGWRLKPTLCGKCDVIFSFRIRKLQILYFIYPI